MNRRSLIPYQITAPDRSRPTTATFVVESSMEFPDLQVLIADIARDVHLHVVDVRMAPVDENLVKVLLDGYPVLDGYVRAY